MYGTDATFIHSNGLVDNRNFFTGPGNQFDLTQAYVDVAVPVGDGLRIRAGKFVYFKQLDPNASVFYSHSFTFGAALPFTLTGIYGTYQFGDQLTVDAGISRGWDQATRDNNGAIDAFGRVKYTFNDTRPASPPPSSAARSRTTTTSHYRTVIDATLDPHRQRRPDPPGRRRLRLPGPARQRDHHQQHRPVVRRVRLRRPEAHRPGSPSPPGWSGTATTGATRPA